MKNWGVDGLGLNLFSDFSNFIMGYGLLDVGFSGNKYTWCNNQAGNRCIRMRLDRVLMNGIAIVQFPLLKILRLPKVKV